MPFAFGAFPFALVTNLVFFLISYRFGHFGPGSAETDITVLSFRLAKRGRALSQPDSQKHSMEGTPAEVRPNGSANAFSEFSAERVSNAGYIWLANISIAKM